MRLLKILVFLSIAINCSSPINKVFAQMPALPHRSPAYLIIESFTNQKINSPLFNSMTGYFKKDSTRIDTIIIDIQKKTIAVYYDKNLANAPIRPATISWLKAEAEKHLGDLYDNYTVDFYSNKKNLETYIPNYYQPYKKTIDKSRIPDKFNRKSRSIKTNISKPIDKEPVLQDINIALWHSHGWYYEPSLDRWEWQRARLFQTVEDLSTMAYVLQGVVPMLENAGVQVFLPRERSLQTQEVIVDNNGSTGNSIYRENIKSKTSGTGFAIGNPPYSTENPFKLGTYTQFTSHKQSMEFIEWIPEIPESGEYPVYIAYHHKKDNSDKARYKVHHTGGITEFDVNQQMGGGTWIYLGTFHFNQGIHVDSGKVVLSGKTIKNNQNLTADAVRFGGGMGTISRNGKTSGRPRYQEAARYYLQYAGMPDSLVWLLNREKENDYSDDVQSRGEWLNYLMGAPAGPAKNRTVEGLKIPIDLALAFHTDAGIAQADSVIGTLGIYSTNQGKATFPNGVSKMASRDLTDLIQTQLVTDLRQKYDTSWIRRGLWDRAYSEAFRPNVPTMLLELLSHQNFLDARFGWEPMFRFDVSRAIYKGIHRFLSVQYHLPYVIQPLPVSHFNLQIKNNKQLELSWKPVSDPLEPTAEAEGYLVYTRKNGQGFDNGQWTEKPFLLISNPEPETIYSFKVTAVNKGGESFPSEILSVALAENAPGTVLIVNAFDRIAGPAALDEPRMAGFMNRIDEGIGYQSTIHYTGSQYDYERNSPWLDDDSPGFGASGAEMEDKIIPGNTFDYSFVHGQSILNAGCSFVSTSDEAFTQSAVKPENYFMINFLAGEEKTHYLPKNDSVAHFTIFSDKLLSNLQSYLNQGGNLLITGAHIGSDVKLNQQDSLVGAILKYKWRTNHASRLGKTYFTDTLFSSQLRALQFNTAYHPSIYKVESPDAIEPYDSSSKTILRYAENNMSAGVLYSENYMVAAFGFPFETILWQNERDAFMKLIIDIFTKETINNKPEN
ncbi:MAG: xanthan lyase [Salinivirgaceae bacterium]